MARPKTIQTESTEQDRKVNGVEVETNIVSISIDGVEYTAKNGIIIVPAEFVEIVKSHG